MEEGDFEAIDHIARLQKRSLSLLTALTYHDDSLIAWRAVQAIGLAARRIAVDDPEYVRVHLRRLNWLLSEESGGIGWRAPEAIGEIIAQSPGKFDEFIPPLFHFLDMEAEGAARFRAGVLWAIGRIGAGHMEALTPVLRLVLDCLNDADPQVRGLALWCLKRTGFNGEIPQLDLFRQDHHQLTIYEQGESHVTTIAHLAEGYAKSRLSG